MSRVSLTEDTHYFLSAAESLVAVSLNVSLSMPMWENAFQFQIRKQFAPEKMEAGVSSGGPSCQTVIIRPVCLSDAKRPKNQHWQTGTGSHTRAETHTESWLASQSQTFTHILLHLTDTAVEFVYTILNQSLFWYVLGYFNLIKLLVFLLCLNI